MSRVIDGLVIVFFLSIVYAVGSCSTSMPVRVDEIQHPMAVYSREEDDLEQLAASAREEHERKQAAQIEAIEAVQANGWKGWHPPYEPIGD